MQHTSRFRRTALIMALVMLIGAFASIASAAGVNAGTNVDHVVYASDSGNTYVPAGYTYIYEGSDGRTYTSRSEQDRWVCDTRLSGVEAQAIAELAKEYGTQFVTGENGNVLQIDEIDAKASAEFTDKLDALLGISSGGAQNISLISDAYTPQSEVRIMVTLKGEPVAEQKGMNVQVGRVLGEKEQAAMRELANAQTKVAETMRAKLGYGVKVEGNYTLLTNSFAAVVKYGDLKAVNALPEVEKAYVMPKFNMPDINADTDAIKPNMQYAGPAMGANETWDLGYKGEGMTVAVIDTGLCYENPAFSQQPADTAALGFDREYIAAVLESDLLHAERLTPGIASGDLYQSDKVPFGYNYADGKADGGSDDDTWFGHGSHVAGIVAGNLPEGNSFEDEFGITQLGIAPEAQLVVMKVFDIDGNCYLDYLVAAVEDALMLGVDCANLSLGSAAGPMYYEGVTEVYDNAYAAGVNVVVSSGNEASTGYKSLWGDNMTKASSPSTGTVGMPGTFDSVLTVASAENMASLNFNPYIQYSKGLPMELWHGGLYPDEGGLPYEHRFTARLGGESYEYAVDTFENVVGKIVFVDFAGGNADAIVTEAADAGAAGILLYNSGDETSYPEFTLSVYDAPAASVSFSQLIELEQYKPETLYVQAIWDVPETAGEISEFSSWGPTEGLTLKPEITGIGGNVFSAYYGEYFAVASGTSMASPAVAACGALIRQRLKEAGVANEDLAYITNCLLMSTATPIIIGDKDVFYSVRQQGAGLANAAAAIHSGAYITVEGTNKAKIELGDDPQKSGVYTLKFNVVNFSDEDKSYSLETTVQGQKADGGQILNGKVVYLTRDYMREMEADTDTNLSDGALTVPAGATAEVEVTIRLSGSEKEYIDERFENGSYVEGFVRLLNAEGVSLSIPFLGFYGDWGKAPVLESGTYDTLLGGEKSFTTANQFHNSIWSKMPFEDIEGTEFNGYRKYLGDTNAPDQSLTPYHEGWDFVAEGGMYWADRNAISPNGDFRMDGFEMGLGLLRNAENIHYTVYNADTGEVLHEQDTGYISKTYYDSNNAAVMYGGIYDEDALSYEWIYPVVTEEWGSYYDTSRCLLEDNTRVVIRAQVTPEYQSDTENSNYVVEFPMAIDLKHPVSAFELYTEYDYLPVEMGMADEPTLTYQFKTTIDEAFYTDYAQTISLDYNEEAGGWDAFIFTSVYQAFVPGTSGWSAFGTSVFGEKSMVIQRMSDYAGNIFNAVLDGSDLPNWVDLKPDTASMRVGETLNIANAGSDVPFSMLFDWEVSDETLADLEPAGNDSAALTALKPGKVTVTGGILGLAEDTIEITILAEGEEEPTPTPVEPTQEPVDPDDPPKAGGMSMAAAGGALTALGAVVLAKRRKKRV